MDGALRHDGAEAMDRNVAARRHGLVERFADGGRGETGERGRGLALCELWVEKATVGAQVAFPCGTEIPAGGRAARNA